MFWKIMNRRIRDMTALFNGHFVEVKAFYALQFDEIPCIKFISELNMTKAFAHIKSKYQSHIVAVYQHSYFDHTEQCMHFNNSIFVLTDKRMIELAGNHCQILHTTDQYNWAGSLIKELAAFREVKETKKNVIGFARQTAID